jgi:hypothetical protein
MSARRTENGGGADGRPHCVRCRRPMYMRRPNPKRKGDTSGRFFCQPCGASCAAMPKRPAPLADVDARPWCVRCRRAMRSRGAGCFCCKTCGAFVTARTTGFRRHLDLDRPACRACGRPKGLTTKRRGRAYFGCNFCRVSRRALHESPETAAALLKRLAAALPAHLTPDEREDAAQSMILDMLAGRLAPVVPGPQLLRRYAAEARGMASDRFRFISLSQPTRDGREFGDTLAA